MATLDWVPICTDVAALSVFHRHWKKERKKKSPEVDSFSFGKPFEPFVKEFEEVEELALINEKNSNNKKRKECQGV